MVTLDICNPTSCLNGTAQTCQQLPELFFVVLFNYQKDFLFQFPQYRLNVFFWCNNKRVFVIYVLSVSTTFSLHCERKEKIKK
jgi:hypothetical protein